MVREPRVLPKDARIIGKLQVTCAQCGQTALGAYVKSKKGFIKVCVPCGENLRDSGELIVPEILRLMEA